MSESRAMLVSALPSVSRLDYMSSQRRYGWNNQMRYRQMSPEGAKDGEAEVGV